MNTKQRLIPFLTFHGDAEQAMHYYDGILPDAVIESIVYFEKGQEHGEEGKVLNGCLSFSGQKVYFMDVMSSVPPPDFSWAMSLYVNCADEKEFDLIFDGLSKNGTVMMGPEAVLALRKVAWVTDRFGITWQLVWA